MRRVGTLAVLAGLALAAAPAGAAADETRRLRVERPVERSCSDRLLPTGAAGVARERWTAPAEGYLTAKLGGDPLAPDWDLAAFGPGSGNATAASTSSGSLEQGNLWVESGDAVTIQACRLAGGDHELPLYLDLHEMAIPEPSSERFSLESVEISGHEDVERLEALGLDVTHDVTPDSATVALYSDAERAALAAHGFRSESLARDFAADQRAQLLREAGSAGLRSNLPSSRDGYRVYRDYTSEMKELAGKHPNLVRPVVIGTSLEGRPIEGVEIAADVNAADGRPVYLNIGLIHAREWPSGEFPMEFALDLARNFGSDPRITAMLERARVVIVPVVNPDGFIASRSFGETPADDMDPVTGGTLPLIVANSGAYRRKNCRGTTPQEQETPCAARTSGVDLNRNFGAYWGGPGSSSDPTTQSYRGTGPFSEPESQAVRDYTSTIHPTVFVTNHTFTDGRWLRQPGFDADFLPQTELGQDYDDNCGKGTMGAITPDEPAMKALGDAMAAANEPDWISELGYETLCDITGATEDWNYFNQGTYGYTPEARGPNFHASYAQMVVAEYLGGDGDGSDFDGMRGAFVVAGEEAGETDNHGVIEGNAPPGATLRLRKEFDTPTCEDSECAQGNGPPIRDVLRSRLGVPDGTYEWHVNPSGRPLHPGEVWTMSCSQPGRKKEFTTTVAVGRGERVTVDWAGNCGRRRTCQGEPATLAAPRTPGQQGRRVKLTGTQDRDVMIARGRRAVVKGLGGDDAVCGGRGNDRLDGGEGNDSLRGGNGNDRLSGRVGADALRGNRGRDTLRGGAGADRLAGGRDRDRCPGARPRDKVVNRCE